MDTEKSDTAHAQSGEAPSRFERPEALPGETHRINMGCGHVYHTINEKSGEPVEILCRVGKGGGCQMALLQGIGRLASLALQAGAQKEIISKTLTEISCPGIPPGDPDEQPSSCLDALARIIVASSQ